jgi:uncharacterized circularly permuted ATP-grasp superfamily protein/uncharacterized alpha-E superfamily protein
MTTSDTSLERPYRFRPGVWDERATNAPGDPEALGVAAAWDTLHEHLVELGDIELDARNRRAARLLREDGVTFDLHQDGGDRRSAWDLDAVPSLVEADQWSRIERGVAQRAVLLDAVLADIAGPQRLLTNGLLPPEVLWSHRGHVRAAADIRLPGAHQLVLAGFDLARSATGATVLSDHTQVPTGIGYALENRSVTSRVMPEAFDRLHVRRLAPFFRAVRATMTTIAPGRMDDPRIVVLSPGRRDPAFFEHAFLATQLGYPLVEGADLTVRAGRVAVRTLGGLEPVHVVLRQVDAPWCDPLELRPDSQLGPAGLLEAARRGSVSIINHPGAGVVENPGLAPFLPEIARRVLGEELLLEAPRTWWCGDPPSADHVLHHLDDLVLRPISRGVGPTSLRGDRLGSDARESMARRIQHEPHRWVGQEVVPLPTSPAWSNGGLVARPSLLRTFAVADGPGYAVLPGGVTRVGEAVDGTWSRRSSVTTCSKDTWALSTIQDATERVWLPVATGEAANRSQHPDPTATASARSGENLYWLGRYAERAEQLIRMLRVVGERRADASTDDEASRRALDVLAGALASLAETSTEPQGEDASALVARITTDVTLPGSLASTLASLLGAAEASRDQLSTDTWLVVAGLRDEVERFTTAEGAQITGVGDDLTVALRSLLALSGLAIESMVRDGGWLLMDAGRRIERGLLLASLLRSTISERDELDAEALVFEGVLRAAESMITYRRRFRSKGEAATLIDLVMLDRGNPRSLAFQADRLVDDLAGLPRSAARRPADDERPALELAHLLRLAEPASLGSADAAGRRTALDDLLTTAVSCLEQTGSAIDAEHFSHLQRARAVGGDPGVGDELVGRDVP